MQCMIPEHNNNIGNISGLRRTHVGEKIQKDLTYNTDKKDSSVSQWIVGIRIYVAHPSELAGPA
jgi:hypothetical protein